MTFDEFKAQCAKLGVTEEAGYEFNEYAWDTYTADFSTPDTVPKIPILGIQYDDPNSWFLELLVNEKVVMCRSVALHSCLDGIMGESQDVIKTALALKEQLDKQVIQ